MSNPLTPEPLSLSVRIWFWLACALRVLLDGAFAGRVWAVRDRMPAPPEALPSAADDVEDAPHEAPKDAEPETEDDEDQPQEGPNGEAQRQIASEAEPARRAEQSALVLLALLQREGRLVDFLEQDIETFDDADIGAAARVLHAGCRKALHRYGEVETIRAEDEDSRVQVATGIDSGEIKLVGAVTGAAPYRGVLRHRGWRVRLQLPEPTAGHDVSVVAPAEVEL